MPSTTHKDARRGCPKNAARLPVYTSAKSPAPSKSPRKKKISIRQIVKLAQKENLSYGQYVLKHKL